MSESALALSLVAVSLLGCAVPSASYRTPWQAQAEGTLCFDDSVTTRLQDGGCAVAGDALRVRFRNELSSAFVLRRAMLSLDGEAVLDVEDEALLGRRTFVGTIHELSPGEHVIESTWMLQGEGSGVFSYLKGYRFEMKNVVHVRMRGGRPMGGAAVERAPVLSLSAFDGGGPTTPLEQRPRVRSEIEAAGP